MKQPDLFAIYIPCKECGKSFHRITQRRMFCCHKCAKRSNDKIRKRVYDEYRAKKIAAE
jgi:protein-arginine kinase activator protein McsA